MTPLPISSAGTNTTSPTPSKTTPDMYPGSYARSALRRGLALERSAGANPYAFGMIGSTDDHTSLATAEEDNFFGKFANSEPGIRTPDSRMAGLNADWELGASGLAAVWAPQNTREDLFASMKRREVYATTGSRIVMRFFGGWDYAPNSVHSPYFETIGYRDGVPMGGELSPQGEDAPTFMVQAMKDPDAANLDQVQIIKGWIDRARPRPTRKSITWRSRMIAASTRQPVNPNPWALPST